MITQTVVNSMLYHKLILPIGLATQHNFFKVRKSRSRHSVLLLHGLFSFTAVCVLDRLARRGVCVLLACFGYGLWERLLYGGERGLLNWMGISY
jgi:hypothetical protein